MLGLTLGQASIEGVIRGEGEGEGEEEEEGGAEEMVSVGVGEGWGRVEGAAEAAVEEAEVGHGESDLGIWWVLTVPSAAP